MFTTLGAVDYAVILIALLISAGIGILLRTKSGGDNTEFLLAGRNAPLAPIVLSIVATFMSATTLMGIPTEMYLYGTHMVLMNIGFLIGPIISAFVFLPMYHENKLSTVYEYLELRFGKTNRRLMSAIFGIQTLLYTASTLFAPALALSAVTQLPIWISIVFIGSVCTFYCTLGGMRAVIWTDVFQCALMYACVFAVVIKGSLDVGGIDIVMHRAFTGGRLLLSKFSFDLTAHYTFFNVALQGIIITLSSYSGSQLTVQRLLSLKSLKRAQIASFLSAPLLSLFHLFCCLCGVVIYANFYLCDPVNSSEKPISAPDQLLPYFITTTMADYPGLAGLCIAGIFSASLSTISSAINSLASITSEDFLQPIFPKLKNVVFVTKILSIFYGCLCMGLSFVISAIGNLIHMLVIIFSITAGPQLGLFILAAFSKTTNEEGATIGMLFGVILNAFLSFIPREEDLSYLPLSNECPELEVTTSSSYYHNATVTLPSLMSVAEDDEKLIHLGYMWITTFGFLASMITGFISSWLISCFKKNQKPVPDAYLSPVRLWFCKNHTEKNETKAQNSNNIILSRF